MSVIKIEDDRVELIAPEGATAHTTVSEFVESIAPRRLDTRGLVLPPGVKATIPVRGAVVAVHETPPAIFRFRWIAKNSPAEYGRGTKYRDVRVALPFVVMLAVYDELPGGELHLGDRNEVYFRNHRLESLDDELFYPALLNCSKFDEVEEGRPLSWICTQHLERNRFEDERDPNRYFYASMDELWRHLLETGFNRSSEHHELASWFTLTVKAKIDPRLGSIEAWEKATESEPGFATTVPWMPTGRSVGDVAERISGAFAGLGRNIRSARDLERIILRSSRRRARKAS